MVIAVMPRKRRRSYGGSSHMLSLLFSKLFGAYPFASVAIKRSLRRGSAERERKNLHARIEKRERELPIGDGLRLPDQLIEPLCRNRAIALVVYINSVRSAGRLSIDEHAKAHGSSPRCRPHDEMQIAGVKTVRDAPMGLVQHNGLLLDRPLPCKRPMIAPQRRGGGIDTALVQRRTARRRKIF